MNGARSTTIFWVLPVTAGVLVAAACAAPWTPARIVFAVPPALLLTGYALMRAISGPVRLELYLRVALTLGLSLVTLVLGAMILDFVGIYEVSWAVLLTVVTALGSFIAYRRGATGPELRWPLRRVPAATVIVASAAVALAVAAVGFSRVLLSAPNAVGYTELAIRHTVDSGTPAVTVRVSSEEQRPLRYALSVKISGRPAHTWRFGLRPSRTRTFTTSTQTIATGPAATITAVLSKHGSKTPYRTVTLRPSAGSAPKGS